MALCSLKTIELMEESRRRRLAKAHLGIESPSWPRRDWAVREPLSSRDYPVTSVNAPPGVRSTREPNGLLMRLSVVHNQRISSGSARFSRSFRI